ncbi:MAG: vitamin K epoxide reductase family protein [Nocardioides sp.]
MATSEQQTPATLETFDEKVALGPKVGDLWSVVTGAALIGAVFTGIQIVEKITILKNPEANLVCDLNTKVSCSTVLDAWQSSVLGPPNSLVGAVMFSVFFSGGLASFLGSRHSRSYVATMWGLAVFFLAFASWFMFETAFSIRSLCPWCVAITTAVVVICVALTRVAAAERAFGDTRLGRLVDRAVASRFDLAFWGAWWLVIAAFLADRPDLTG